jgi:hypothetical protein
MGTDGDRERGLYGKYIIHRSDGSSGSGGKHEQCDHFVLDLTHDRHALAAISAYALSCEAEYPALYDDLIDKIARYNKNLICIPPRRPVEGVRGGVQDVCTWPPVIPLGNGCWFCTDHAIDDHVRGCELGDRAVAALKRRGVDVPKGRKLELKTTC